MTVNDCGTKFKSDQDGLMDVAGEGEYDKDEAYNYICRWRGA